jgi:hypothetical protein
MKGHLTYCRQDTYTQYLLKIPDLDCMMTYCRFDSLGRKEPNVEGRCTGLFVVPGCTESDRLISYHGNEVAEITVAIDEDMETAIRIAMLCDENGDEDERRRKCMNNLYENIETYINV